MREFYEPIEEGLLPVEQAIDMLERNILDGSIEPDAGMMVFDRFMRIATLQEMDSAQEYMIRKAAIVGALFDTVSGELDHRRDEHGA